MKTKTLLLAVVFTSSIIHHPSSISFAQSPNWAWAKSAGGSSWDYGSSVSTDAGGNVFVTGYFSSPTITFGTTTLTNADNTGNTADIFIVKYDAAGTVLWAKSAGGTSDDVGRSVSTNAGGNVFVTGHFGSNTITFGTTALTNAGGADIFIVKYDNSGTVLWARAAGGTSGDVGYSVSADAGGNVFVMGYFFSPAITFGTTALTNAGNSDIFIAKLGIAAGIESPLTTENEILIYPNPTGGKFVVQITNQYRFTDYELEIYNVYGEKVYESVVSRQSSVVSGSGQLSTNNYQRTTNIDLSEAPNGIYFILMQTEQGTANKKLIIQH